MCGDCAMKSSLGLSSISSRGSTTLIVGGPTVRSPSHPEDDCAISVICWRRQMTLSVLLLSRYARRGPSSRVRFYIYEDALARAGISLTFAPFFEDDYLIALYGKASTWRAALSAYWRRLLQLASTRRYDLLWIEKELMPWLPAWFERTVIGSVPYAVDFDDAWFLRYRQHRFPPLRALLRDKLERIVRDAALTVVGNQYLAEWARDSGARAILPLPTVVDVAHYSVRPRPDGPFTIGWIGTPSNAANLTQIVEPLRRRCRDGSSRLLVIGAEGFTMEGIPIERAPWDEDTEAELLSRCDVG